MRMRGAIWLAVGVGAVLALTGTAQADIIYDNGSPDLGGADISDYAENIVQAEDFVLEAGATTITDIHWWGLYAPAGELYDNFKVVFYTDDGGSPADVIVGYKAEAAVNRTDTGQVWQGYTVYEYHVDIAPLALEAGTTYYVSIMNSTHDSAADWYWMTSSFNTGQHWTFDATDHSWSVNPAELAFYLTWNDSVVPEPASLSLLTLGLAGLAVRRFRGR